MSTQRIVALVVMGAVTTWGLQAQAQDSLPKRKAGLWEIAMQMDGKGGAMPAMSSQHCVDDKSDEAMQRKALAGTDRKSECKQTSFKRISGGVEIEVECKGADGVTRMLSRMTGDMAKSYTVDSTMKFTPPRNGMSEAHMTMKATHGGACPAGMNAGDVRVGGMNFNPGQPGGGFDVEKIKNMTPEQRAKFIEDMKKAAPGAKP